jgi:hypothetical protein
MAWLHAVPKPPEGSKRAKSESASRLSRIDRMKKDGIAPAMPPCPAPHIIARLIEIGITENSGMGPAPLSWREIQAWQQNVSVRLAPWEARLIRSLSLTYLGQLGRAESESCPAPWHAGVTKREIEVEEDRLRSVLG